MRGDRDRIQVWNGTRACFLAESAQVADTGASRRKGLLGRENLARGEALWIVPCQGIHTWMMRFSIDVVYLDRKKRVRKLRGSMSPWRLSFCLSAHSVLELPAGRIEETGTRRGDQLDLSSG
jgi:hypothetical protein